MERYNSGRFIPELELLPAPMSRGAQWRNHYRILLDCLSAHATREPGQASINQVAGVDGFPVQMVDDVSWVPLKSVAYCRPARVTGPEAYHHAYPPNNDWAMQEKSQPFNRTLWCLLEYYVEGTELWELIEHLRPSQHGREAYALIMAHCSAVQIIANHAAFQERLAGLVESDPDPAYARHRHYRDFCLSANGWGPTMYGTPLGRNVWGEPLWTPPILDAPLADWMRHHLLRIRSNLKCG